MKKHLTIAAIAVLVAATYVYAATWSGQGYTEDATADGTEKVFVENGAGTANNFMTLATIKTYIDAGIKTVIEGYATLDLSGIGTLSLPTNVTLEIAAGTATLGTTAIADGACATVVTVAASGVATTDVINPGYNVTPVGVTGYDPTAASLSIIPYPTAGNVNFLVCNATGASITPGAMTINWRVDR